MKYQGFIGGSYESQAFTAAQMRTVNWYLEKIEDPAGTTRVVLLPTPGVETIDTFSNTGGRANYYVDGRQFAVVGTALVEIDEDGAATWRNPSLALAMDTNPATISSNGDGGGELFITSGGNGYIYNLATTAFSQVTALNGKATMGAALDGYFLALDVNTGTLYSSDLLDGLTWTTGIMFAQRISAPDPWISLTLNGKLIWLQGEHTSEVWHNSGASPFPFAPHPSGLLIPYGIAAPFSARVCDSSLMWLGSSPEGRGFTLRAPGFEPEVVSTYPVQYAVSRYGTVSDCYGDTYNDAGHTFYLQRFGTANVTWVYDLQMSQWHERATWDPTSSSDFSASRLVCHAFAFGEHRWLDATSGSYYRMSSSFNTDAGGLAIRRLRRAPSLQYELERVRCLSFELDAEPGLGSISDPNADPVVLLRMSNDGGKTWGSERPASAGKQGEYGKRMRWERCGMARRRVFEVTTTEPLRLTDAYLQLEGGPARRAA